MWALRAACVQRSTVTIHVLLSRDRIDEIAYRVVHRRLAEQEQLIEALQESV